MPTLLVYYVEVSKMLIRRFSLSGIKGPHTFKTAISRIMNEIYENVLKLVP